MVNSIRYSSVEFIEHLLRNRMICPAWKLIKIFKINLEKTLVKCLFKN